VGGIPTGIAWRRRSIAEATLRRGTSPSPEIDDPDIPNMETSLHLTQEDAGLLREVIAHYLSELHSEIAHTDNYDLRETLHGKQHRLNALMEQLGSS